MHDLCPSSEDDDGTEGVVLGDASNEHSCVYQCENRATPVLLDC